MKAIVLENQFGLDNLKIVDRQVPQPKHGQVLLRMKAASLNYRDLMTIRGEYNPKQPLPIIPCSDGAGEVVALGEGVASVRIGERVTTTFFPNWLAGEPTANMVKNTLGGPLDGTLAEYMVASEHGVIPIPEHLTDLEAATLPCAGLTAWNAIVSFGQVKAGDTVLIQGTGGVALFCLMFAKLHGCQVMITSRSKAKLDKATQLGADFTLQVTPTTDWAKNVKSIVPTGVDLVVELGGANTLAQSFQAARLGGAIALIGVLSGIHQDLNILPIIMKSLRLQGIFVGSAEQFAAMNKAIAKHALKPIVSHTFVFNDVKSAFEVMAKGEHFGKIGIIF